MKRTQSRVGIMALALAFLAAPIPTPADDLRIRSLDNTGQLTFNRIPTGQSYRVECATSLTGAWTRLTNAVTVDGIPTTMNCIPGPDRGGLATGAVPMQASAMFFRAVAETNDMALIPAGAFIMSEGSYMPHEVYVSSFYMDRYEVTKAKWDSVFLWATNRTPELRYSLYPSYGKAPTHPVVNLCWWYCLIYCNARSEMEGLTPCYTNADGSVFRRTTSYFPPGCNWAANGYRLPTEAEWEKAARGGVSGHRFPWSDSDTIQHTRANYYATTYVYSSGDTSATLGHHPAYTNGGEPYTSPVGSFAPNGYGLYDMAGNASELVWDSRSDSYYANSPRIDPRGPSVNPMVDSRVIRGGSWGNPSVYLQAAYQDNDQPSACHTTYGFRTARTCVPPVPNHPPVIAEGASVNVTMSEDDAPTPFGLTLHATDEDNDPVGWWVLMAARHGMASVSGYSTSKDIAYTPTENYFGSDSFVVQAYDIWSATTTPITVNVTIQPVNDAPVANDQSVCVATNRPRAITLTGFDIEGAELTYAIFSQPTHGALSGAPPNVTYTPNLNYKGYDSFTFKVNDGADESIAPAIVTLWVNSMAAQGGTMTNYTVNGTNYTAHIFTTVGSNTLFVSVGGAVEVLVVAGGGGGGCGDYRGTGGGGGAGGLINTNLMLVAGTQAVTVGAGGVGDTWSGYPSTPGSNSTFAGLTALGGGCAKKFTNGVAGGSGAGGFGQSYAGGAGNQPGGYGNNGGAGGASPGGGGGGGGAGGAGGAGVTNSVGGNGGIGRSYDISGVLAGYAGGGGGGAQVGSGGAATDGGGRGADGVNQGGFYGVAGSPNTGGGGGGGLGGAAGGSGIVIVRYGIAVP